MKIEATPCVCGRPGCWHINLQRYAEQQARNNRLVSIAWAAVIMIVIVRLLVPPRRTR